MDEKPILLVDDDPHVLEVLSLYLKAERFPYILASNGQEAIQLALSIEPRLIVLDLMLPKIDGIRVCQEIRAIKSIPIIMLTAKSEDFDKILGLEIGADDYITKPFNPKEVIARIKAVLRRTEKKKNQKNVLKYPQLEINLEEYLVKVQDQVVQLTPKETELLWVMASNPNMVYTRETLLEQVWGYAYSGETRTVDTHVKRLRKKLITGDHLPWDIITIWGVGYKFGVK